jgi:hypothetical protein
MTPAELRERANLLRNSIVKLSSTYNEFSNNQASMDPVLFMTQRKKLVDEMNMRKDALTKIMQAINAMTSQGQHNGNPNLSNQFPGNQFPTTPNLAQFTLPPPLDKAKFQESYTAFCSDRSIAYDERVMSVDNRPIDLHALHHYVLSEGGSAMVTQRDLWTVIGARMGFVQFPGTDTEPDKSGPSVALQLQHLYEEYLAQFDQIYVHSALRREGFPGANSAATSQVNNPAAGNTGGNIPGAGQVNMMNAVMVYANTSAADMRGRGVPEGLINFVEQNRSRLQQTLQQQSFRGMAPGFSNIMEERQRLTNSDKVTKEIRQAR